MKRLLTSLVILVVLLSGCVGYTAPEATEVPAAETPAPETPKPGVVLQNEPPADRTWISPGKVNISNYYPGGRAEYPVTIHNGRQKLTPEGEPTGIFLDTQFEVKFRKPDHVATGYIKAPSEIQSWIIIADASPVLMPKETRDVLVVLAVPSEVDESMALVWQFTREGSTYLTTLRETTYIVLVDMHEKAGLEPDEARKKASEELEDTLFAMPEANLLMYLDKISSVTFGRFYKERSGKQDVGLMREFSDKNYVVRGDLRKDKWEFWISVIGTTQTGMVRTELATRWLVSMR